MIEVTDILQIVLLSNAHTKFCYGIYRVSKKGYMDLVGFCRMNLALINSFSISKHSSIIYLKIGILFVSIGSSIADI